MANFNVVNNALRVKPRYEDGNEFTSVGAYAYSVALASADTITFIGLIPAGAQVLEVTFTSNEIDTNASPSGTVNVGDGTTPAAFIAGGSVGLSASGENQVTLMGNGVNIGATYKVDTNVVVTVASTVATGATSGTILVKVRYYCAGIA